MFRRQQQLECHVLSLTLLQQLIRLVVSLLCSCPEKEKEKYFVTYIATCLQLIINTSTSHSFQDFKDAIAIYPDLSNVRYDAYLIAIAYSGPFCTFLLVDIESSIQLCRLKDLELLLQNVAAASQLGNSAFCLIEIFRTRRVYTKRRLYAANHYSKGSYQPLYCIFVQIIPLVYSKTVYDGRK